MKVLIGDETTIEANEIHSFFQADGHDTYLTNDGIQAIKLTRELTPDLIVLNMDLKNLSGADVCEYLKARIKSLQAPVILVANTYSVSSELKALSCGADEFVSKPIHAAILQHRIKRLLQVNNPALKNETVIRKFQSFEINLENRQVSYQGKQIELTKKEFDLLVLLTAEANRVFTRQELFHAIWPENSFINDRTLDVHIRRIRQKTADHLIFTVKKVGYKFNG